MKEEDKRKEGEKEKHHMQSLFCKSSSHSKLEEMAQLIETLDQPGGGVTVGPTKNSFAST